jgi:hypothetical protein
MAIVRWGRKPMMPSISAIITAAPLIPYARNVLTTAAEPLSAPIIAALGTIIVAILSALAAYLANKRERRRRLYGEAIRAAVRWKEMLYRVRRRVKADEPALIQRFHDLQDDLSFYEAWVGAESKYMKASYDRFVASVKGATEELIRDAWATAPRARPTETPLDELHPDLAPLVEAFLKDARSHLSPWPWRKLAVWWRNRSKGHA